MLVVATVATLLFGQVPAEGERFAVLVSRGVGLSESAALRWGERVAGALRAEGIDPVEGPVSAEARIAGITASVLSCDREVSCLAERARSLKAPWLVTVDVAVLGDRAAVKVEAARSSDGNVLEQESGSLPADADEVAVSDLLAGFALRVRKQLEQRASAVSAVEATEERRETSRLFWTGAGVGAAGLLGGGALLVSAGADLTARDAALAVPDDAAALRLQERARLKQVGGVASLAFGAAGIAAAVIYRPQTEAGISLVPTGAGLLLVGSFQ